jgi:hypothetical protein
MTRTSILLLLLALPAAAAAAPTPPRADPILVFIDVSEKAGQGPETTRVFALSLARELDCGSIEEASGRRHAAIKTCRAESEGQDRAFAVEVDLDDGGVVRRFKATVRVAPDTRAVLGELTDDAGKRTTVGVRWRAPQPPAAPAAPPSAAPR